MLTEQSAIAYVADYFAKCNYEKQVTCEIICAAPCYDDDCEHAVDVFFRLSDYPEHVNRFTVWIEHYPNVAPFIYGEW